MSTTVTCLEVFIDSELIFAAHIRRLTGRCFYQLRKLRSIRRTLTTEAAKALVHALVITCVDYCNSIFGLTSAVHLRPLQSVVNAAARLIVKIRKYGNTTTSHTHFAMTCPDCLSIKEATTSCAYSFKTAYTVPPHPTSLTSVFLSPSTPRAVVYVPQLTATSRTQGRT